MGFDCIGFKRGFCLVVCCCRVTLWSSGLDKHGLWLWVGGIPRGLVASEMKTMLRTCAAAGVGEAAGFLG